MANIFDFCTERIEQNRAYRGKRFREGLVKLAKMKSVDYQTRPGHFSGKVSDKNTNETAFQRALYSHSKIILFGDGHETPLTWRDIELPIILSKKSRRPCVDLIGQTSINGTFCTFLCELKYAKPGTAPPGNAVDYAVFEALLYYAIVNRDHALLHEQNVYRPPRPPKFSWKAVSDSRVILVLANDNFWIPAQQYPNLERLRKLVKEVRQSLGIRVLLCSTPNYTFCRPKGVIAERYGPELVPCAEEVSASFKILPTYRLVAFFDSNLSGLAITM